MRHRPERHAGVVVLRLPVRLTPADVDTALDAFLATVGDAPLSGRLLVVDRGRVRRVQPAVEGVNEARRFLAADLALDWHRAKAVRATEGEEVVVGEEPRPGPGSCRRATFPSCPRGARSIRRSMSYSSSC